MEIKVCGPGCASCEKTLKIVEDAIKSTGVEATLSKITDFQAIAEMGIFTTPGVVVDGVVKSVGNIPKQADVEKWIS